MRDPDTRRGRRLVAIALLLLLASHGAQSATSSTAVNTPNTKKLAPGSARPSATIAEMAWLAGHWRGEALGGQVEEIWSGPEGGAMMGMYRLLKDGKTVFYEFLTIVEHDGSLALRLKHFHPDLKGWEERDVSVEFPLVATSPDRIDFEGMAFVRDPAASDRLTIHLAMGERGGSLREATFHYSRSPQVMPSGQP